MRQLCFLFLLLNVIASTNAKELPVNLLKLPSGFHIAIYAYPVLDARGMALGNNNIVFVGTREAGKVYAVIPDEHNANKTKVVTIASGLKMPNGVVFYQGNLYVADVDRVLRYDNIEQHLMSPPKPVTLVNNLPNKSHHGWRYMRLGPDKKLYIGIGAPCNICKSTDERFATIMRMDLDGKNQEIYAHGIRNTVGFEWEPTTQQLWFTNNGRDWMGDNLPPDELNVAPVANLNFGFPYCHSGRIKDQNFGKEISCDKFTKATVELPAHVAALGMTFYTGDMFPKEYKDKIFVAEHGSWNRSSKVGYQVITVNYKTNPITVQPFITGWLQNDTVWGRPVDLLQLSDGSLLISDDHANAIYRVTYQAK